MTSKLLIPNAETVAAMEDARAGRVVKFTSVEALMEDLSAENSHIERAPEPLITASSKLVRDKYGVLVVQGAGSIITSEQVKEESEDDLTGEI